MRSRAADSQAYVAGISASRVENDDYISYGHSMFVDPEGMVLKEAGIGEEIVFYELGRFEFAFFF